MSEVGVEISDGTDPSVDDHRSERGATLVLGALVLLVLLGMAGFAVDLGWLLYQQTNARKAAEAAALAGVVHMPLPSAVTFGPGAEPWDVAVDVASRSGYPAADVTPEEVTGEPNQLHVDVETTTRTFFMQVFGIDSVDIAADATAEQLPPLKIGSDESYLGSDPTIPGRDRHFWVAVNGEREIKENGDPFSTRCTFSNRCGGTPNIEQYRDPAYFYAIEVPDAHVGADMTVEIYDGGHWRQNSADFAAGDPLATGDRTNPDPGEFNLDFQLHSPDQTPGNPEDNPPIGACYRRYVEIDPPPDATIRNWTPVCTVPSVQKGIYVLSVSIGGGDRAITDFAIRVAQNGLYDNTTAVFGMGAMSLDMIEADVNPEFKLVRLDEVYAGTQLLISLFDPGDVTGPFADLSFVGEASTIDCSYRVLNHDRTSVIQGWGPDDSPGAAPCELDTEGQRFNNQWLEFTFDVPPTYTCTSDCWMNVNYNFPLGATVNERTTWAAAINGQPIHLVD